ncbi:DinB family protein [Salinisphaera sp. P385]|uniref:DinB family protein n=1 Tax=Spectribacter acetivorans TaxID=3075603 RepID=A0ABU3BBC6_9GAMM|nr:DinB family protein [Salinisphaera sp. P385]MDT0619443.1 DinB family protein [Salinisphaera sp. P385]
MISPDHVRTLAAYNRWMNERLYAVCATIDDPERKQDRGAFFGSLHGTLNHLLDGDMAWLARFRGDTVDQRLGEDRHADFDRLTAARHATDEAIEQWAAIVSSDWLAAPMTYTSNVDGLTRRLSAWVLVTHFFNHQTHHRGQITTLLSQMGVDYGVTDLPWLPALDAVIDA